MKVCSWNVNGLRSVWGKGFLDFVEKFSPDVLCLQEIKIDSEKVLDFGIEGYDMYFSCAEKKGYSGVLIYCKKSVLKREDFLVFDRFDFEGRGICLRFSDFVLVNVYMPHGGRAFENLDYKLKSYDEVLEKVGVFLKDDDRVLFCGDFNVAFEEKDLARPRNNLKNVMFSPVERKKLAGVFDLGFRDCFRELNKDGGVYSWWPYMSNCRGRNIGWRIDYVFASDGFEILGVDYLKDVLGSDHCPVLVEVK